MTYLIYAFGVFSGILLVACMKAIAAMATVTQNATLPGRIASSNSTSGTDSQHTGSGGGGHNRTRRRIRRTPDHRDKPFGKGRNSAETKGSNKPKCLKAPENVDLPVVVVPMMAIGKFLSSAQPNTECNIETCGLLAGKLIHDQFHVTHVLVPKQCGTPDSCTTFKEEDIVNFHEKEGTLALGWIHTHPKQSSFLSSLDLHTQYCSEMQFAPAVAIVCAIEKNQTGYFSLTGHGRRVIRDCKKRGFHEHSQSESLYQSNPSHLVMDRDADVILHDMR